MSDSQPGNTHQVDAFLVISKLAHVCAIHTELPGLLQSILQTSLDHLPLTGAVIWLRSPEHDILTPIASRVPYASSAATSAIAEDDTLVQRIFDTGYLVLEAEAAQPLVNLPEQTVLAIAPIHSDDALLGMIGYITERDHLETLAPILITNADVLCTAVASAWLRRQQQEADDVAETLFKFAGELRAQSNLDTILGTLNNLALRVFNCDWSAVYIWKTEGFTPVQIMTRVGEQSIAEEPVLDLNQNPLLEFALDNPRLLSLTDLREQPGAIPLYAQRHELRGLVLVPIQKAANSPLGLLTIGYRAPLTTFSSRATALAHGVARMVAVALEHTRQRASDNLEQSAAAKE